MPDTLNFVVAKNPEAHSRLGFLLALPTPNGVLWLKTSGVWPRAVRLYCHPLERAPALDLLQVLESVPVVACEPHGRAINLILARAQHRRSQFVFVRSKSRDLIFWQTAEAARSARPGLRIARDPLPVRCRIYVDTRERYPYAFGAEPVDVERRPLRVGDYAVLREDSVVAVVERKSLTDFADSIVNGSLGFAMAELATLPLAAVAVEGSYSALLRYPHVRVGFLPVLIARLQVRYPSVAINFLESRRVAEHWTYRFLTNAYASVELPLSETE